MQPSHSCKVNPNCCCYCNCRAASRLGGLTRATPCVHGIHTNQGNNNRRSTRSQSIHQANALSAHLWCSRLVIVKVEVNDVAHVLATAVNHPVMPVKRHLTRQPAAYTGQRAAHTSQEGNKARGISKGVT